ncbi:MAG: hypothetical protein ACRDPG_08305 [Nocardioidaceae bacterium]
MSTFMNQARVRALHPAYALPRPRLTVVPRIASRAPRMPFVLLVLGLLAGGLVGLLLLNTSLEQGAYRVTALSQRADALAAQQQTLQMQVAALQQPGRVARAALKLGMVQNDSPVFLNLATSQIVGKPVAGVAGNQFNIGHANSSTIDPTKVAPVVGGENATASAGVVVHKAATPPRSSTTQTRHAAPGSTSGTPAQGKKITGNTRHHQ